MNESHNKIIENLDKIQCQYEFLVKADINEKNISYLMGRSYLLKKVEEDFEKVKEQLLDFIEGK